MKVDEIVGREQERRSLSGLIDALIRRERRGIALVGEPGIGKTVLLAWLQRLAGTYRIRTMILERTRHQTLQPVIDTLEDLAPAARSTSTAGTPTAAELSVLLDVAARVDPLLVIADDVDLYSADMRSSLVQAIGMSRGPIGLAASARSPDDGIDSIPGYWIDVLQLRPLERDELAPLIAQSAGAPPLPSLTEHLWQVTGGNPLYATELIRTLNIQGLLTSIGNHVGVSALEAIPTPRSMSSFIATRLRNLSSSSLELLRLICLLDRPAMLEHLRLLKYDPSSPDVMIDLAELVEAGCLTERAEPANVIYTVTHRAFATGALERVSATRKARYHSTLYRWLASLQDADEPVSVIEMALHAASSLRRHPGMSGLLASAAAEALAQGDTPAAERFLRVRLAETEDLAEKAGMYLQLAESLEDRDPRAAIEACTHGLECTTTSALRARLLLKRAESARRIGDFSSAERDLVTADALPEIEDDLRFRLRHAHAVLLGLRRRYTEAERILTGLLSTEGIADAQRARATGHLAHASYARGKVTRAIELLVPALHLDQDPAQARHLRSNLSTYYLIAGDWAAASELLATTERDAEACNDLWTLVDIRADIARLSAWRGDFPTALDAASSALSTAEHLGSATEELHARAALAMVFEEAETWEAAIEALIPWLSSGFVLPEPRDWTLVFCCLVRALIATGDLDAASASLSEGRTALADAAHAAEALASTEVRLKVAFGSPSTALAVGQGALEQPAEFLLGHGWLLLETAEAYRLCSRRQDATRTARESLELFRNLGALSWARRAENWLARYGARRPGRPASQHPFGLTQREIEVLWLVTQAKTSREMAASLSISEGTVRKHVEHLREKLGVSNKAGLILAASQLGIEPHAPPESLRVLRERLDPVEQDNQVKRNRNG